MDTKFSYHKLVYFLFFSVISFFLIHYSLFIRPASAQIPAPTIPCDDVENPEFHSLRPYQASPCKPEVTQTTIACGNDLIVQKEYKNLTPGSAKSCSVNGDGSQHCDFEFVESANIKISLPDTELPIVGNTQLVPNSVNSNPTPTFDSAQRTNEYVSWYLNGTNYRAEEKPIDVGSEQGQKDLLSYAGPLRKLLPREIVYQEQVKTIKEREIAQHDQIAVCGEKKYLFGLVGPVVPHSCYSGNQSPATDEYRLSEWDEDLSLFNEIWNRVGRQLDIFKLILPDYPIDQLQNLLANKWNHRYPPLSKDFDRDVEYQKAYYEWRGKSCLIIPIVEQLICVENPLITNEYADLFPYVPLSSTEDRKGKVTVDIAKTIQPTNNGVTISDVSYSPTTGFEDNLIYVPHMEEANELASLLQKTFTAKGESESESPAVDDTVFGTTTHCDLETARWNTGDDLFGEIDTTPIKGTLNYKAVFSCDFGAPKLDQACYDECIDRGDSPLECRADCTRSSTCEKKTNAALSVYTKTPKADELWSRLVSGPSAVFKRIFPHGLSRKPQILDLPAVTTAKYESDDDSLTILAGEPSNNRSGDRANIFIPRLGSIQDYFLKGIQTALRPKDLGSQVISGVNTPPKQINCDQAAPDPGAVAGLLSKDVLVNEFKNEFKGNRIADCYNDVVGKAKGAGYDPAFAMAIWIEESGASDYNAFPSVADFGCAVNTPRADFNAQINCFLGLKASYAGSFFDACRPAGSLRMEDFLLIFSEGKTHACTPGDPCYRKFCLNSGFPARINSYYSRVSGGKSLPAVP